MQKLNIQNYKNVNKNNKYFQFIENCRNKVYTEKTHVHHIIPMYVFKNTRKLEDLRSMNSSENLIELSVSDHIKAHELLYEIYGNLNDFGAIQLLNGLFSESARTWKKLGAKSSHNIQKINKRNMWDPNWQKEMDGISIYEKARCN
jgi:N12 class adenine-specific DNA methylase